LHGSVTKAQNSGIALAGFNLYEFKNPRLNAGAKGKVFRCLIYF